jgi:glycosyltransferase involved in cell wall biosynthesis
MDCGQRRLPLGYVPYGRNLERPADRRRFPRYAAIRNLPFEIVSGWEGNDVIILSTAADVTRWVHAPTDRKIVVDLPDAFLDEGRGLKRAVRGLAKWAGGETRHPVINYHKAVERLLERADAVVCSTDKQAGRIARHNANVHPILDLHGEFHCLPPTARESGQLDIVWEGLTATLPAIRPILPALRTLASQIGLRLHLVTDLEAPRYMNRFLVRQTEDAIADWGIDVRLYQWSVDTLTEVARRSDVAIVPVDLADPMAMGKPENRMRIFWRLGLPVVASATPANVRATRVAGIGERVLCSTVDDWRHALQQLHFQPEERLEIASAGQAAALTAYSEESLALRWDRLFESL